MSPFRDAIALALALWLGTTRASVADGLLAPAHDYPAGPVPFGIALGDLNEDGKIDVVVTNAINAGLPKGLDVLLGNGDGSLAGQVPYTSGGSEPHAVALGDIDGDGHLDAAVAAFWSNTLSMLRGHGDGTLEYVSEVGLLHDRDPVAVTFAHLDSDARPDVLMACHESNSLAAWVWVPGNFGCPWNWPAPAIPAGAQPSAVAASDVDGNGTEDVVVSNQGSNTVSVWLGNGLGGLGSRSDYNVHSAPSAVAVGDIDGDGRADLAVANYSSGDVSILYGRPQGFAGAVNVPVGPTPVALALADLDRDGALDLVVVNESSSSVSVLPDVGRNPPAPLQRLAVGESPEALAIGDLNGDEWPDVVTTNYSANTVSVLMNRAPNQRVPIAVADLEVVRTTRSVRLAWRLPVLDDCTGVRVVRATDSAGPYAPCLASKLVPAARMSFEDETAMPERAYWYRLDLLRSRGVESVGPIEVGPCVAAKRTALVSAREIAGGWVVLRYEVAAETVARLELYDVRGRLLHQLQGSTEPGEHTHLWNRRDTGGSLVPRGVYFVRLEAGRAHDTRKLLLKDE